MTHLPGYDPADIPHDLASLIRGRRGTAVTIGCSGHGVMHLRGSNGEPGLYLKIAPVSAGREPALLGEALRLGWLRERVPVPEVILHTSTERNEYLLLSEVSGLHAAHASHRDDIPRLIELLAAGLHLFHSLPIDDCPFDSRLPVMIEEARRRLEAGTIDEAAFDPEYRGRSPRIILDEAEELGEHLEGERGGDDAVIVHGDYSLPNIIIAGSRIGGFIDLGSAGICDRHHDLVCAAWSVAYNLGTGEVSRFLDCYGTGSIDHEKLRLYHLLKQLY